MIREDFENIEKRLDIRKNLIEIRQLLKTEEGRQAFEEKMAEYQGVLINLLSDADAKVRKNAALILGETGLHEAMKPLFEAYEKEEQLFVRSSYLTAISEFDYRPYLEDMKLRMNELMAMKMAPESQKHLNEELRLLRDMILKLDIAKKHHFTGERLTSEVILLTSPGLEQLTLNQMPETAKAQAKMMRGGISLKTNQLEELMQIRTIKGILFRFCKNPMASNEYMQVAEAVVKSGLVNYLTKRHLEAAPFYFRIDMKTKMVLNEKSLYVKRLGAEIERLSDHQLQNSASNYEVELRIIENKQGSFNVYLKLDTLPDTRFLYRQYAVATSMHPVRAAEVAALARPYLQRGADVLDPCCGTGTLLLERRKAVMAEHLYGVDMYGEAIVMARENAKRANTEAYFINKRFEEFEHAYRFDEIITELPAQSDRMTASLLHDMYDEFVAKIPEWMADSGYIIVVSTEEVYMSKIAKKCGYLEEVAVHQLSGRRPTALMIYQFRDR